MVTGQYLDKDNSAVPYANVLLINSTDSSLIKGQTTDPSGKFQISTDSEGHFMVSIKFIGYEDYFSPAFKLGQNQKSLEMGKIKAVEKSQQLSEVVVKAEKPLIEQKLDRTVVNVQSNITAAGGSALDVLARSPGVVVDKLNNSIALAGKQGVRVMINGKISRIPLDAVVQMLDGMNAENIEKIELITTPPAKYEAEGDAGLINIVLVKETDLGSNANISVNAGYGRNEKYGGSVNFNNRSKNVNLFGNYSYRMTPTEQLFAVDRAFQFNGDLVTVDTDNDRNAFTRIHNGQIGADWSIGKKTTIGGQFKFVDRYWEMDALAEIYQTVNGSSSGLIEMESYEVNEWSFLIGNINISHSLSENHEISMDVDYIDYYSENPTDYLNLYFDNSDNLQTTEELQSRKDTGIGVWVGKVDYSGKINDKISIEAGAKGSWSPLQNDISIADIENGIMIPDVALSSNAVMSEDIIAGYISTSIDATEKIDLQLGLRYEHTKTEIESDGIVTINRDYGNFFPSVFIQNTFNKNNSLVLSYSRRITRPSFFQIAPFVIFLDPNSFWSGNTALLPAMTDAVKAEYRYKSALLSLQYSYDKNSISLFQPRITSEGQQVSTAENMDYRKNYSISLSLPFNVTEWWDWQINFTGNRIENQTEYLSEPINITIENFTLNASQKVKMPSQFTAELSLFYISRQLWGVSEMKEVWSLDFGIEKKFTNSQLRLSLSDIFNTRKWTMITYLPEENLDTRTYLDFESRILMITYSISLGNRKLRIDKKTGSEEEQRRFQ